MTSLAAMPSALRPTVPHGFVENEPQVRTGNRFAWPTVLAEPTPRSAPIWRIQRKPRSISLKQALLVHLRHEDGFFFAQNETLSICGTGTSVEEAIADFCLHAVHFYDYYKALPQNRLAGDALRLKKTFSDLFVEG